MENKILTRLPTMMGVAGLNRGKEIVDYENMVGLKIDLLYKGKPFKIKILEYFKKNKKGYFKISYNKSVYEVTCYNFVNLNLGAIIKIPKEFRLKIGKRVSDDKRDMIITDREYRNKRHSKSSSNERWYRYKCNICGGNEQWIEELALIRGQGCSYCCGRAISLDINSIWATDRWMCDLGLSEKDAKTHTKGSHDRVVVICPDCGKTKNISIYNIYNKKSISCNCGDKRSYPEKFMMSVLDQLGIKYETQYQPKYLNRLEEDGKWSQKKSDFYLPEYGLIIETDGGLNHKGGIVHGKSKKPLEYYIEVDRWKDEQHLLHGLETTRIDCFKSDMKYIKNNILNSELNKIFDLSKIDWLKCEEFTMKNLVKEVCDYWNDKKDWETTIDLEKIFKLSGVTIRRYLKKGTELGWCIYDAKEESRKGNSKAGKKSGKPVAIFKDNKPYIPTGRENNIFESATEIEKLSKEDINMFGKVLSQSLISKVCNGSRNHHGGYTFKYYDE